MRPPQNAGESLRIRVEVPGAYAASMRPPQNAGESAGRWCLRPGCAPRFNEAPAERGGKSGTRQGGAAGRGGFNEAPAERGGKYARNCDMNERGRLASMRPPQNAGESVKDATLALFDGALQ